MDEVGFPIKQISVAIARGEGVMQPADPGVGAAADWLAVIVAGCVATEIDGRSALMANQRLSKSIAHIKKRQSLVDRDLDLFKAFCLAHYMEDPSGGLVPPKGVILDRNDEGRRTSVEPTPQFQAAVKNIEAAEERAKEILKRRWNRLLAAVESLRIHRRHRMTGGRFSRIVRSL